MAGAQFTREGFAAREEVLSSDLNRAQGLASRELQDALGLVNNGADDVGPDPQVGFGAPIDCYDRAPNLVTASGFNMTLLFGQAYMLDFGVAGFGTGDLSPVQVVRWPQQTVTFAAADPGLPRIDLVVATPAIASTDLASRNIIVNPSTRDIEPGPVNKTVNPAATIAIVAGTPNAQPVAPAVPAGALALLEVYVPAAAASAAAFKFARRVQRRGAALVSAYHGVIKRCVLNWSLVDETTTDSVVNIPGAALTAVNRVVIDGEQISFGGLSGGATLPGVVADAGGNSPFAVAAPANSDKPYYLYLCGGRNLPQATLGGGTFQPVVLVESLVVPGPDGHPSAAITTPRGSTQAGALYVGVGFVVAGTTRRKGCVQDGDWVRAMTGQNAAAFSMVGFNDTADRHAALDDVNRTTHLLNTKPSPSTIVDVGFHLTSNATIALLLGTDNGATAVWGEAYMKLDGATFQSRDFRMRAASSGAVYATGVLGGAAHATFFYLWAKGWNMHVPRLSE